MTAIMEDGDPSLEEQAQTILTTYLQEYWNHVPALDHPVFEQIKKTTSERLRVRLIRATLQKIQQDASLDSEQKARLIQAIIADHLTYTAEEIQQMLQSISRIFAKELPYALNVAIFALVGSFEPALRQTDVLAICQKEAEAFYAQAHVWGNYQPLQEAYHLRSQLGDLLFTDHPLSLASLLRKYNNADSPPLEEQAKALIAAYQHELGNYHSSWHSHPALELLQQTTTEHLKVYLIQVALQEIYTLICTHLDFENGDVVHHITDLINAVSTEILPYTPEDIQDILRESERICSWKSTTGYYTKDRVDGTVFALLQQCEPSLRQEDVLVHCQTELASLYTSTAQWRYYGSQIRDAYHTRMLIGDLLFAGNPPGLASLLRKYTHDDSLSLEEQARTALTVYHQEMKDHDEYFHPLLELVQQDTTKLLKVRLLRDALQEALMNLQKQPYTNNYAYLPPDLKQTILLIKALFSEGLPYSSEDIRDLLACMNSIFAPSHNFYALIDYEIQVHESRESFFLNLLRACAPSLKQPETLALCQKEASQLYTCVSQCLWNGPKSNMNQLRILLRELLFPESKGPLRDLLEAHEASFKSDTEIQALLAAYHQDLAHGILYEIEAEIVRLLNQKLTPLAIMRLICLTAEERHLLKAQRERPDTDENGYLDVQDLLLIRTLCKKSLLISPEEMHTLLHGTLAFREAAETIAFLLKTFASQLNQPEFVERCYQDFEAIQQVAAEQGWWNTGVAHDRNLQLRLTDLLSTRQQQFRYPLLPDAWGKPILEELTAMPVEQRDPWLAVLNHCVGAKGTAPAQTWLEQARSLSEALESETFTRTVHRWISFFSDKKGERMDGGNSDILRGLIWFCMGSSERTLAAILADTAIEGYRKLTGLGPRCPKAGDAAVITLESMRGRDAIGQLERVRQHVKQPSYQTKIGQALDAVAQRENMTRIDLEELMVPTFDLHNRQLHIPVDSWTAQISVGGRSVQLSWIDSEGNPQSNLPAAMKRTAKEELKVVMRQMDDIEHLVSSQRDRLERMFLNERHWPLQDWRERYLEHPLLGGLTQRLIWQVRAGEQSWLVIWHEGRLVDVDTQPIEFPAQAEITLWHPLMSNTQMVLRWCLWLETQQVTQPFKQAHREIYPLTEAEQANGRMSQRFAGHYVRQHQLLALAKARGWHFSLHSDFSGSIQDDPVTLDLSSLGIRAEFAVHRQSDEDQGISRYLITAEARFPLLHLTPRGYHHPMQLQPLEQVPPIIFSEVMRDVDLFVSVTSAGADPNRYEQPQSIQEYWQSYNQSELSLSAQGRKQVLERLIPRLAIAERCTLEERFLHVRGDLCTYRIHLGSGNILMEPEYRYLCIVFDAKARETAEDQFFLPFEGDPLLALILSKAFLLADDTHIKDKSILNQIRSR